MNISESFPTVEHTKKLKFVSTGLKKHKGKLYHSLSMKRLEWRRKICAELYQEDNSTSFGVNQLISYCGVTVRRRRFYADCRHRLEEDLGSSIIFRKEIYAPALVNFLISLVRVY